MKNIEKLRILSVKIGGIFLSNLKEIVQSIRSLSALPLEEKIDALNEIKMAIHEVSPFNNEPVDCVIWVKSDSVQANDYNPNSVADKEMDLLKLSIEADGYTQPVVTFKLKDSFVVIDGFHRNLVAKTVPEISKRIYGRLPITVINHGRSEIKDRMAATVRHNRARGKHGVVAMSDIVAELSKRKWSDKQIAKELGMDADEVLRLKQITGLAELFSHNDFSEAWEVESIQNT